MIMSKSLLFIFIILLSHLFPPYTLYAQTSESSVAPASVPIMVCCLLKPNYRGLSFDDEPKTQVEALVKLNLKEWNLSLDDVSLYARFGTAPRRDLLVKKSLLDLTSHEVKVKFELEDLPIDDYTLAISLRRKNEEAEYLDEQLAFKAFKIKRLPAADRKKMTLIKSDGSLLVNDQPFFPLGIYLKDEKEKDIKDIDLNLNLKLISEAGFNCVLSHQYGASDEAKQYRQYLDETHKYGLKVIYSIRNFDKAKEMVSAFKDHSAIIAWYVNGKSGIEPLEKLKAQYEMVKALDLNHPVGGQDTEIGEDEFLIHDFRDFRSLTPDTRPLIPVFGVIYSDQGGQKPEFDEKRHMAYSALVKGAKGLIFSFETEEAFNRNWDETKRLVSEVKTLILALPLTDEK